MLFINWNIDIPWTDRQYQLLDVTTGEITNFEFPDLDNFVELTITSDPTPLQWVINPSFDYQAYLAWVDENFGSELSPIVVRVQHIPSGDFFEISPAMIDNQSVGATVIDWKSDYLLGLIDYGEGIEFIFDVLNQERVAKIQPPVREWEIVAPSVLTPNLVSFASLYRSTGPSESYIIELHDIRGNHVECFQLGQKPTNILLSNNFGIGGSLFWTHDSRFLWWLECSSDLTNVGACDDTYQLMIFDSETKQYSRLLSDVGINTRIGFLD